jgi:hypothetical protein
MCTTIDQDAGMHLLDSLIGLLNTQSGRFSSDLPKDWSRSGYKENLLLGKPPEKYKKLKISARKK